MNLKPYVIIDFDNTIAPHDENGNPKEPYPGALKALSQLRKLGMKVIIHSARYSSYLTDKNKEINNLKSYLYKHKVPYDGIWPEDKLIGIAYVDDKAVPFKGNWDQTRDMIIGRFKKEQQKQKEKT